MLSPATPDVTVPARNVVPFTIPIDALASLGATHAEAVAPCYTSAARAASRTGVATLRIVFESIGIEVANSIGSGRKVGDRLFGWIGGCNRRCDHGQRKKGDERGGELHSGGYL